MWWENWNRHLIFCGSCLNGCCSLFTCLGIEHGCSKDWSHRIRFGPFSLVAPLWKLVMNRAANEPRCSQAARGSARFELVQTRFVTHTNELEPNFVACFLNEPNTSQLMLGSSRLASQDIYLCLLLFPSFQAKLYILQDFWSRSASEGYIASESRLGSARL